MRLLKTNKGVISIEAILSLSVALFVIVNAIGWYNYMLPRQGLEKQVHLLAQKAKIQGGLTATSTLVNATNGYGTLTSADLQTDLGMFLNTIQKMGHDISKVKVTCLTSTGNKNCLGVSAYTSSGTNYIKRKDMDTMVIRVEIPAKTGLLGVSKAFFGSAAALPDKYIFSEAVMSERW